MAAVTPPQVEFSRRIKIDDLGETETIEEIEANESERQALAARLDILSLDRLTARVSLRRLPHEEQIRLDGSLKATMTQACVVTLAPVATEVEQTFSQLYYLGAAAGLDGEVLVDLDVEDPPEAIEDGVLDVGEAVAEHLSLALDPYPRSEGAALRTAEWGEAAAKRTSPFAALEGLKQKNEG